MNEKHLIGRIIDIITDIQEELDTPKRELSAESIPLSQFPEFDSQIWVTVLTLIADDVDVEIPLPVNIFTSEDGSEKLSIRGIAHRILDFVG